MSKGLVSVLVLCPALFFSFITEAQAQGFPNRPIALILPMAPGDGLDIAGRAMADELAKVLRVSMIPLNKPGAAATAGSDIVAKAKKDGYTILLTNNASLISTRILHPDEVPYDPFKDLTPLALVTQVPSLIAIRSDAPYKNFKEVVDYAKRNPGRMRCGTMGVGSVGDFNVEIVKMVAGAEMTIVPFKGGAPGVTALLGGHIEAVAQSLGALIPHIRSGSMRAVATSLKFRELPDVPTLKELGYQEELLGIWFAFFAPAGIDTEVKATLVSAIEKVAKDPSVASKLGNLGMIQDFEPPNQLLERMRAEYKLIEGIAKRTGMMK